METRTTNENDYNSSSKLFINQNYVWKKKLNLLESKKIILQLIQILQKYDQRHSIQLIDLLPS